MKTRWHYAVWKGRRSYMFPACTSTERDWRFISPWDGDHGITIIRGHVDCPDCKRMMGMV